MIGIENFSIVGDNGEGTLVEKKPFLNRRLGAAAPISSPKALLFKTYVKPKAVVVPEVFDFWKKKKPIPVHDWGNNEFGCCTIASQGVLSEHAERIEQRKTIQLERDEIVRVYFNMIEREYGSREDSGAYETTALSNFRNPDYTFRDSKGRPLTIDAYTRINHLDVEEVKTALFLSGHHGIKVCFALPIAWAYDESLVWDIPEGQKPIGNYRPYTWGAHSTTVRAKWNKEGVWVPSTWGTTDYFMTWRAFQTYATEGHVVFDSLNQWKKRLDKGQINFNAIAYDVNSVSDLKLKP